MQRTRRMAMDDNITISAKTYDEAITKAMIQLQTTREHLAVHVVQEGTNGFLGIGGRRWTIEAHVMSEEEETAAKKKAAEEAAVKKKAAEEEAAAKKKAAKEEAAAKKKTKEGKTADREKITEKAVSAPHESQKAQGSGAADKTAEAAPAASSGEAAASAAVSVKTPAAAGNTASQAARTYADIDAGRDADKTESADSSGTEERAEKAAGRRQRGQKNRRDSRRTDTRRQGSAIHEHYVERPVGREVPQSEADEIAAMAVGFLNDIFRVMEEEITIDTDFNYQDNELSITLSGDDMGVLIGKRGQTLDSLQYLTSLVVNKHRDVYIRVKLDTENYRERREAKLKSLAKNIARKVKQTKRPVSLEPMNPYERRIIHSALQRDPYVTTYSEGEDPYRHVVVILKKDFRRMNQDREEQTDQTE